jgi:hypothetical protein
MSHRYHFSATRRGLPAAALLAALAFLPVPASAEGPPTDKPSGRIKIQQLQIAFVASGSLGGGTLTYKGRAYPIQIGGLGVGGVGASRLNASGDVYGLQKLSDFSGAYLELKTGWALGDKGKGRVWLRNANGVLIKLKGAREGLQLATGASGVVITLK